MKKLIPLFIFILLFDNFSSGQFTRYIVKLKNKGGSPYSFSSPLAYLSQRAIDRRTRYGIAIDSLDLPLTPAYVNQIRAVPNVTLLNTSKWLNSLTIQTSSSAAITTISGFSFVQSVNPIAARPAQPSSYTDKFLYESGLPAPPFNGRGEGMEGDYYNYGGAAYAEIHLHNAEFLHNIGLRGQGMLITMLDAGFYQYTTLSAFDSGRLNGQFLSVYDFVAKDSSVIEDHPHGMECLSTIVANLPGQFVGKAPKASFHLFRTEDANTEYPIEEHNWVCGAERADSAGADVISSSLGYNQFDNSVFDHTYSDMNGRTTLSAIGANLAARKGIMVFNAAGNEGNNAWHYIITPADADSIVAVGAVNSGGTVGSFSSYGPSSDGRIKPELASIGVSAVIESPSNVVTFGSGTSFATPNMAGMSTCLWQAFPEFNNVKVIRAMEAAASKYTTPDNRVGYGIPNMKTAFANLLVDFATSSASVSNCIATVNWTSKDIGAMKYEVERKLPNQSSYVKIADKAPAAGTILAKNNYQLKDTIFISPAGTVSYRIRQIIDTATATFTAMYIDTANITLTAACDTTHPPPPVYREQVSLQPSFGFFNTANLVVETPYDVANLSIVVYNSAGQQLFSMQTSKTTGKTSFAIDVSNWQGGIYYFKVMNGDKILGMTKLLRD